MSKGTRVYLEVGGKRTFASAADWPGWSRSGKTPEAALEALASYAPRYAAIPKLARIEFPKYATQFEVVEKLEGNATTDFGAPGIPAKGESKPTTNVEHARLISLLEACWKYLDRIVAKAPAELRKGPRGGGRDRDKMFQHVLDAELEYGKGIGVRLKAPDRKALLAGFRNPKSDGRWPVAYAIRRTAWHALDHAWEIEDRIP
ncbi:MAG: hypothetical protein E6H95_07280 [Chloroflexi bacterium]|nr:MAG: hypothetical protein E6H95_07280 [Chloroflexota bacterium]